MIKLPKFPIKVKSKDGESFVAHFKSIGDPKRFKVVIKQKSGSKETYLLVPKEEVLSWGTLALRAFELCNPHTNGGTNGNGHIHTPGRSSESLHLQKPPKESTASPKALHEASVLRKVRGGGNPSALSARAALPNVAYRTAKSNYLCRYGGMKGNFYVLEVYYPDLKEWKNVEVSGDYQLTLNPTNSAETKETKMPKTLTKPTAAPEVPANGVTAKTTTGLTVYEAWGKAFQEHGTKKEAPELIVKFMESSFPGRKTMWAKWVNPVRARYNAGKLPGVPAPAEKLAVYKFEDAPARTGEDRREKKERRTPPLKSVRKKTPSKPVTKTKKK